MPAAALDGLQLGNELACGFLAVGVEQTGVVGLEQGVLDAGKAGALATLDDNGLACKSGVGIELISPFGVFYAR